MALMACFPHCDDIFHRLPNLVDSSCPRCGGAWKHVAVPAEPFNPIPPTVLTVRLSDNSQFPPRA